MIDVNLTGSMNIMQLSKTEYLPLITQVVLTLLTIFATLGGVYLSNYLSAKSEEKKHQKKEKEQSIEERKKAYIDIIVLFNQRAGNNSSLNLWEKCLNVEKYGRGEIKNLASELLDDLELNWLIGKWKTSVEECDDIRNFIENFGKQIIPLLREDLQKDEP
jgi:hypothetical protein